MKTILCFGDSNTWGYSPQTGTRFPPDIRWTGVLQKSLGDNYRVIEEGLNGRTTFINEEGEEARPLRSGSDVLQIILEILTSIFLKLKNTSQICQTFTR